MRSFACAFTGHRPMKFSFGYDEEADKCIRLKRILAEQISALISCGVSVFYSGMAQGVDQWGASIVLVMKQQYPNVRLTAVLPYETQANKWSPEQRERYFDMLTQCDDVVTLNLHYTSQCMLERNRYLVDHADYVLAVYDGGAKGGTAYTVRYAREKNRQVTVIRPDTLEVISSVDGEAVERRKQLRILPGKQN
ncbi:MAG: SLOG family protein [Proteiniphilum sp.]|nr:SLOG family protein [Proteiniphilum sp.]